MLYWICYVIWRAVFCVLFIYLYLRYVSIKIWNLEDPPVRHAISLSYTEPRRQGNKAFATYTQQLPIYNTTQIHNDYVDSVCWVGNCLLSKSTKNKVVLWKPDADRYKVQYNTIPYALG